MRAESGVTYLEIKETRTNTELWQRLSDFEFDDPDAELPFSRFLAVEQRWSRKYADRAIGEYRRFLYLTQIAPHDVTRSKAIDSIWHLHLLYTQSYWAGLCPLFERPLHHGPSMGGPAEGRRYESQYSLTLATYEQEFDEPAPTDIWPRPGARPDLLERLLRAWCSTAMCISAGTKFSSRGRQSGNRRPLRGVSSGCTC